jgi:chromosome segregation ATPase
MAANSVKMNSASILNKSTMSANNTETISKLSERLMNIQNSLDNEKSYVSKELEKRLFMMQDKFKKNCDKSQNQLTMLKNHLSNLEKALDGEREHRDGLMQQKLKERQTLENKITSLLEEHASARKDRENKLIKAIEDKSEEIQIDLLKDKNYDREREHQINEIPMLKENLTILVGEREEMEQSLLKQTSDEFERIRESIEEETRAREESEDDIANYVREVAHQLQERVQNEKIERERMEESILGLLEETCLRLNSSGSI